MIKKIIPIALLTLGAFGCSDDDENNHSAAEEFEAMGVLISDAESQDLYWYNHHHKSLETFESTHAKGRIYRTGTGRYAAIIHRDANLVEYFDSGLELHGNHVDVHEEPGMGKMIGEAGKPTHFKSSHDLLLSFNDEDGTLLMADESDISESGVKMNILDASLTPHHGAMAIFDNGTIAVTKKTGDIEGSLPEQVQIIDQTGTVVHEAILTTNGIHGNASDGNYAVFGSASGILVVSQDGSQKLIDHPEGFGESWFGSILSTRSNGIFIGHTSSQGIFVINVETEEITPLFTYSGLYRCAMDVSGSHVLILLETGVLHVFDLSDLSETASGSVIAAFENSTGGHGAVYPSITASSGFAYITDPDNGQLLVINLADLEEIEKVTVSSKPYSLSLVGHEVSEGHH